MRGWKVTTGATSAPSSVAITSLLPTHDSTAAYFLQRPSMVSTGVDRSRSAASEHGDSETPPHAHALTPPLSGSSALAVDPLQGLDLSFPLGLLPAIPEATGPHLHLMLQQRAAQLATDGHSSGHSGSAHVDLPDCTLEKNAASAAPAGARSGGKAQPKTYQLRTRSSSLRAAWVEVDGEEEAAPAVEASTESEGEGAESGSDMEEGEEQEQEDQEEKKTEEKLAAPRKRVGRPLAYNGDPDAPHLTDQERRKIKRRIANRESARRVRAKRAELMDELQIKCTALGQQNARLLTHVALVENQKGVLGQQVGLLQEKLQEKANEAVSLYNQLFALRKLLPMDMQPPQDPVTTTPPASPLPLQGASMFVPVSQGSPPDGYTVGSMRGMAFL